MGEMDDPQKKGVIPRIIEQTFDAIMVHGSANIEYTVGISYLEIYMERIRDLLNPAMDNLPIHEGPKGPYVKVCAKYTSARFPRYTLPCIWARGRGLLPPQT